MKTLIKNATLIPMNENKKRIEQDIDILIEDDKITKIEKNIKDNVDKTIDASKRIVLPGLINTHSHVPMSIFRETIDDLSLKDWLTKKIWPMEDKLTDEDIYYASLLSFIEMIKTGCTTINDMYFKADSIIKAQRKTGIRLQTSRCLMSINGDEEAKNRLVELKELYEKYKDDNMLSFNIGIHGLYTSDTKYVKECLALAKELDLPIHMHFCENKEEVDDIIKIHGKTPVEVLKKNFKGFHTILAHSVKLTKEDLKKIKDMDIHVSTGPISNLKLGCGIAPITEMKELSINISLGTDGQGSGCNLDLFEVMKFVSLLQKGIKEDPTVINSYDVLKMATINGAKALGLDKEIGSIEIGKKADMIILNLDEITLKPTNDLISEIVYNANGHNVETTIINGNILMENKKLTFDINESEIMNKCDTIINRIK